MSSGEIRPPTPESQTKGSHLLSTESLRDVSVNELRDITYLAMIMQRRGRDWLVGS